MRLSSIAMALGSTTTLGLILWASGCSNLSDDCELNLNCPPVYVEKPNCSQQVFPGDCDACLQTNCCKEMSDCSSNSTCLAYCVANILPSPPECTMVAGDLKTKFDAVTTCMTTKCPDKCPADDGCNPITHNGCTEPGSSCDLAYPGVFGCYSAVGTPANLCEKCDFHVKPYCGSGLRCHPVTNTCARYCCDDTDCGTGRCETDPMLAFGAEIARPDNKVGICVSKDPMMPGPACDAPMMPMTDGSCFAGYPGK